jgi:hypothetical protein
VLYQSEHVEDVVAFEPTEFESIAPEPATRLPNQAHITGYFTTSCTHNSG